MLLKKLAAGVAALSLVAAAPAVAQSSAQSLSVASVERAAAQGEGNELATQGGLIIPGIIAAIFIVGVLLAAGVFDGNDRPVSP